MSARNKETTVTTTKTEIKAFLICSFIGKITLDSSALE
jgi:hypothetical protein